jgi:outer membrane protein OmpA-like peptidoglycan-associated protein
VKFMPEYTGTANLCGLNITARFKLGGNKNVRNIALADYEPNPCAQAPASNNSAAVNQQKQQISDLENTVTNQDEDIQTLQSQINDLKNKLEQNNEADKKTEKPKSKDAHTFANINFATNSSTIVSSSDSELDNLAEQLKQNPTWKVNVTGFADTTGNDAINNPLSKRRAEAIKTYLVKKGVAASAITTKGMGSKNPIATNKTPEGRALNRRVEIQVVK